MNRLRQAYNQRPQPSRGRVATAAWLLAGLAVLAQLPPAASQNGGGEVTNELPVVDADGNTTECGALAFGDVDGTIGPVITTNDGVAGRTYDATGTSSDALKWGEWSALPGAADVESGGGGPQNGRYVKATSSAASSTVELFGFEVYDTNTESDVVYVRVNSTNVTFNDFADEAGPGHPVTAGELSQTVLPGSGPGVDADGYAVWNPTANNGRFCVQFRYTWPAGVTPGTYTQRALAKDEGAEQAAPSPGDDDTTTFVSSASVTLDVSGDKFVGQTDAAFDVAVDANLDFHWEVVASPAPDPSLVTFTLSSVDDADGAITVSMDADETLWVYYKLDIRSAGGATVIKDQTYAQSFTFA